MIQLSALQARGLTAEQTGPGTVSGGMSGGKALSGALHGVALLVLAGIQVRTGRPSGAGGATVCFAEAAPEVDVLAPDALREVPTPASPACGTPRCDVHRRSICRLSAPIQDHPIEPALAWLKRAQSDDGRWDDVGATGLALLAFLGASYADWGAQPYARSVRRGLRFLTVSQRRDGRIGTRLGDHAIATLALCEAYTMTRNPRYRRPAQCALDYAAFARNPAGVWGRAPRGGKTSTLVTGWMVMALKAGSFAGLSIDPSALAGARDWMGSVDGGAVAAFTRMLLGEESEPPYLAIDSCSDMTELYFGTLATFRVGGESWRSWKQGLGGILREQRYDEAGSTALRALCSQLYHRYDPPPGCSALR